MTGANDNNFLEDRGGDNLVQSFQLELSNIRGRIVRFGRVMDDVLTAHAYPGAVGKLTAEMMILASLLSSSVKYEGIFTLQAQGKGPVRMAVSDMTSDGHIRACAAFKEEELFELGGVDESAALLGEGHMAFTVDQGDYTERYQGIVALDTHSLTGSIQNYFTHSEQIATSIVLKAAKMETGWRGAGIIIQKMPDEALVYNSDDTPFKETGEDWSRAVTLLTSVKAEELLSEEIGGEELLFRLFHEEGVRVFTPKLLINQCRCSPDRVKNILSGMSAEDLDDVTVDGKIVMTCEFCSTDYTFDPNDFLKGDPA